MNKTLSLLFLLTATLLSASCGRSVQQTDAVTSASKQQSASPAGHTSLDKYNPAANIAAGTFAFRFFTDACAAQPRGNLMLSPLSAGMALGMVAEGATGKTRDELLRAMGFETLGAAVLHNYYRTLTTSLTKADSTVTIGVAGSVWADRQLPLTTGYTKALARDYAAQTRYADFADGATVDVINAWAAEQTHGRIARVVESLSPAMRLVLLNAVYFNGKWENAFDNRMTIDQSFRTDEGNERTVPMMHRVGRMRYASAGAFDAVELPYSCGRYAMVLLLPRDAAKADEAFAGLDYTLWRELQDNFGSTEVRLALPRFESKYSRVLNADLAAMGVRRMFESGRAELGGISPEPLCVDMVKQDTYVRVDEAGTEAAAVTSVTMRMTALRPQQPIDFRCDRPFAYVIYSRTTGAVLFAGRMSRP